MDKNEQRPSGNRQARRNRGRGQEFTNSLTLWPADGIHPETGEHCGRTKRWLVSFQPHLRRDGHLESKAIVFFGPADEVTPQEFLACAGDLDPIIAYNLGGHIAHSTGEYRLVCEDAAGVEHPPFRCYVPTYELDERREDMRYMYVTLDLLRRATIDSSLLPGENPEAILLQGVNREGGKPTELVFGRPLPWKRGKDNKILKVWDGNRLVPKQLDVKRVENKTVYLAGQGALILLAGNFQSGPDSFVKRMLHSIEVQENWVKPKMLQDGIVEQFNAWRIREEPPSAAEQLAERGIPGEESLETEAVGDENDEDNSSNEDESAPAASP